MTGKQDNTVNRGCGPFCFRIQGKINYVIGDLVPKVGETPKFGQLYIYDQENEVQNRINVFSSKDNASSSSKKDIDHELTKNIKAMLDKENPLIKQFRMVGQQISSGDSNVKIRLLGRRDRDSRQHNLLTTDEVAALIIEDGYRTDIYLEGITDDTPDNKKNHGFAGYPFDYRVTLGFGSIVGGLDLVNPVIRLPLEHGISRVLGLDNYSNLSVGTNLVTASIT
ncbi:hypothetical protein Tco_1503224 [Tanacetum coccineum]